MATPCLEFVEPDRGDLSRCKACGGTRRDHEWRKAYPPPRERDATREAALADLLRALVGALPTCEACDSAQATNETTEGFKGCDEHRSPDSSDLPWADELRAAVKAIADIHEPGGA